MEIVKSEVLLPIRSSDPGCLEKEKLAFILDNVLTKEECEELIKETEEAGYEEALLNVGGTVWIVGYLETKS